MRSRNYALVVLALSVLDQSPIPAGASAGDALETTLELARLADRLGYARYWLAEHHSFSALAGSAPEILVGHVAAATTHIRVGSGGVMLPHYSPLKVAETFSMLEVLHPGRIDLGIGRAPGADPLATFALKSGNRDPAADEFPNQLVELVGFLQGTIPDSHPYARIKVMPDSGDPPQIWLLGSGGSSAHYAAQFGMPYAFAHFISPTGGEPLVAQYREAFRASATQSEPHVGICVSTICAETDEEADELASSLRLWRLRLESGDPGQIPTVEEALGYPYTASEQARVSELASRFVVGSPDRVKRELLQLVERLGADELFIVTICHDQAARLRSYVLIADAFGLKSATN